MERVDSRPLPQQLYLLHSEKKSHPLYTTAFDAINNRVQITLSDPNRQNNPDYNKTLVLKIDPQTQTAAVEEIYIGQDQIDVKSLDSDQVDLLAINILDRMRPMEHFGEEEIHVKYSINNGKSVTKDLPPLPKTR